MFEVLSLFSSVFFQEMKLPVVGGEGPFGIILCPSRELARQTFDVVEYFCQHLKRGGFPELRTVLCIGEKRRLFLCGVVVVVLLLVVFLLQVMFLLLVVLSLCMPMAFAAS